MSNQTQEIERKFLVRPNSTCPALQDPIAIRQGYIVVGAVTVRIRSEHPVKQRTDDRYVLCFKSGEGLVRTEVEIPLTKGLFKALWPLTQWRSINKKENNRNGEILPL